MTSIHKQSKEHKKRVSAFHSLRSLRPAYRRKDGAHPLRGGKNGRQTMQKGDSENT